MKEVYIDCTSVILTDMNTGIQRVERNIITESFEIAKKRGVYFQPVCLYSKESYVKIDLTSDLTPIKSYLYKIRLNLNEFWRLKRLIKSVLPSNNFNKWIDSNWVNWKKWFIFSPLLLLSLPSVFVAFIYSSIKLNKLKWQPKNNHIFIIPGSLWWENNDLIVFLNKVNENCCSVVTVLYDIIPITHPEYVDKKHNQIFTMKFPLICNHSDLFIAISKAVKYDVDGYLVKSGISKKIPNIESFRLGCELDLVKENKTIRKEVTDLFSNKSYAPYVCVGSVEPRKNHKFLLDAFDKLWESGRTEKLCIIGRHGWLIDDLVKRILKHPQYGNLLFWFKDLTDNELSFCYKHARCLIFPSIVEGFGLPLVEALNYQCPVMASDIPVFHEIGGRNCAFFSLNDTNELVKLIKDFETSGVLPGLTEDIKNFYWPNWKESTEEFWAVLDKYLIEP